jgi:hypothetical protein
MTVCGYRVAGSSGACLTGLYGATCDVAARLLREQRIHTQSQKGNMLPHRNVAFDVSRRLIVASNDTAAAPIR